MAREDEADNYMGSFLFWITMAMICSVFPRIVVLSALWVSTFGDCFNALTGQALGGPKILWNRRKTLIGSLTMFTVSVIMLIFAHRILGVSYSLSLFGVVALVATLLESLPLPSAYDEFTVPFSTALILWLVYGGELMATTW